MGNVVSLIDLILSDPKLAGNKNLYRDEPILKTASQMSNYFPPEYRKMKKLALSYDAYLKSDAWLFYKQGKLMEDFEDNFDYQGEFLRYYPTYQSMNDSQLRGYFSWRTKVRHGEVERTSLSFVFVYIYELLNLIGVKDALEGFDTLKSFRDKYIELDPQLDRYVKTWLREYVVYYGLERERLDGLTDENYGDSYYVLMNYSSHTADEVFSAMTCLSTYSIEKSKLYKAYPEDVKSVACGVFFGMSEYFQKRRKNSYSEHLFGKVFTFSYAMFQRAVFYERDKHEDTEFKISETCKYSCKNGSWSVEGILQGDRKSRNLGTLLKNIDALMRQRLSFTPALKQTDMTKILEKIINSEIDKLLEEKKRREKARIDIDVSKLQSIRSAAMLTQEKLIVDPETEPEPIAEKKPENNTGLSDVEYRLLSCLLYEEDYTTLIKECGVMLSVVTESINEKLFDRFSDTVIAFEDDKPYVLEDYSEELKEMLSQ